MKRIAVVLAVLLAACGRPVSDTQPKIDYDALAAKFGGVDAQPAKFQLIGDTGGHVWKMDLNTGELWMCTMGASGKVLCYAAFNQPQ